MARAALLAVVGAFLLLLLPGSATAGAPVRNQSWTGVSGGYQTGFDVSSPFRVFYLNTPRPVSNPTVTQGGAATCQPAQPDGNPNQFECFFGGSGVAAGTHVVASWQGSGIDPNAHFQFFLSRNGQLPYEGPFDVPPLQGPGPPKRTDLTRFQLGLARTAHRPTGFVGHFSHYTMEDLLPDVGYEEDLFFPPGFHYAGADMPKCSLQRLMRGDRCSNAVIGTATLTAYAHDCHDALTPRTATPIVAPLTLFNFGKSDIYALRRVPGQVTGFDIRVNRNHLSIDYPEALAFAPPNTCIPVTDVKFEAPIKRVEVRKTVSGAANRRKVAVGPFVTGRCPRNRIWRFTDRIKFSDGSRDASGRLRDLPGSTISKTAKGKCRG